VVGKIPNHGEIFCVILLVWFNRSTLALYICVFQFLVVDLVVLVPAYLFSLFHLPSDIAIASTMNFFGHLPFGNPKISCNAREYDIVFPLDQIV
jgi:hypothetical protein